MFWCMFTNKDTLTGIIFQGLAKSTFEVKKVLLTFIIFYSIGVGPISSQSSFVFIII